MNTTPAHIALLMNSITTAPTHDEPAETSDLQILIELVNQRFAGNFTAYWHRIEKTKHLHRGDLDTDPRSETVTLSQKQIQKRKR